MSKAICEQYTIRFSDCDPAGHLNNSKYVEYFLNAREDYVKKRYAMKMADFYHGDNAWVVQSHNIQYASPAPHGAEVKICSAIIKGRKQGMVVEFWMTDLEGKTIYALMQSNFVYVNMKSLQKADHEVSIEEKLAGSMEDIDLDTSLQRRMLIRLKEMRASANS